MSNRLSKTTLTTTFIKLTSKLGKCLVNIFHNYLYKQINKTCAKTVFKGF